jgi:hypothetical protein
VGFALGRLYDVKNLPYASLFLSISDLLIDHDLFEIISILLYAVTESRKDRESY